MSLKTYILGVVAVGILTVSAIIGGYHAIITATVVPSPAPEKKMIGLELAYGQVVYTVTAYPGGHVISFKEISQTGNVRAKDLYINDAIEQFCGIWIFGKNYDTLRISYNCPAPGIATFREWKLEELFPLPR